MLLIGNFHPNTTGTRLLMVILLLQARAAVQTSLLLRSGDVEKNPGPGLYPGEMHYSEILISSHVEIIFNTCTHAGLDYDHVDGSAVLSELIRVCRYIHK